MEDLDPRIIEFLKINTRFFFELAEDVAEKTETQFDDLALALIKEKIIEMVDSL